MFKIIISLPFLAMLAAATITILTTTATTVVYAQQIHENALDGFRVEVPVGWVVQDYDNTQLQGAEENFGAGLLAELCDQDGAIPDIGGGYRCGSGDHDGVSIFRFADLSSRPEMAVVSGQVTPDDFLAFFLQWMEQRVGIQNIGLEENEDRDINVVSAQTGETIDTVPGFYIEATSRGEGAIVEATDPVLLVFDSSTDTGYALLITTSLDTFLEEDLAALPADHEQIFDSFELLSTATAGSLGTTPSPPTPQQPEQQPPSPPQQTPELVL
jgi:hypothetical protein